VLFVKSSACTYSLTYERTTPGYALHAELLAHVFHVWTDPKQNLCTQLCTG
jgi:hypothetical protein